MNSRVKMFIDNAIFQDDNVTFIIICNNLNIDVDVPNYVKVIKRENIGFDFGGWSDAILTDELYKQYDYFIFANSSIIGPFMENNKQNLKWTDFYINGLVGDIKLFGSTINNCDTTNAFCPMTKSHVQSYIFCLNKETLEYLIKCEIFSKTNYAKTYMDAIYLKEILMSRKVIENNWNIGCLHKHYNGVDFRFKAKRPEQYNLLFLNDIMHLKYNGLIWNANELIFIKGNRTN
jgi:hypothetical protein